MDRGAWQAHGIPRVGHDLALSFISFIFFNITINKTKSKPYFSIGFFLYSHIQFAKSGNKHTCPLSCKDQNLNEILYYEYVYKPHTLKMCETFLK